MSVSDIRDDGAGSGGLAHPSLCLSSSVNIHIRGAGVAGLCAALAFARRGAKVLISEKRPALAGNASWYAGGMLAPFCERESAEEVIERRGLESIGWWDGIGQDLVSHNGTLVVAPPRDQADLARFARMTNGHRLLDRQGVAELEPDLHDSFVKGLFYSDEAHMDPRLALEQVLSCLEELGGEIRFCSDLSMVGQCDLELDCRGMASPLPDRRGVRGEMLLLYAPDVRLTRTIRLLHPRIPLYVVPRANHHFMVGATMIESDHDGAITARSMMEFLNAAYALVPAFGEAQIIEAGIGVRPAFADNLPRLQYDKAQRTLSINGYYRHGYALGPLLAQAAVGWALDQHQDADFPVTSLSYLSPSSLNEVAQ
ncbi:MAG: FAD-dependent oxidoreductase [Cohaesibacter sp.]|nr:FAD-dependent oxidoreductase [Cohaesibacter sp.]